jgi:hypothetical protein
LSEKQELKRMGAKPQKNSGRGQYQKADGKLDPFLVDVKEFAESFGLSRKVWAKICSDSIRSGGEPSLMIALGSGKDTIRLWVIGDSMFHEMREAWLRENGV